jgi:hypothetical protein
MTVQTRKRRPRSKALAKPWLPPIEVIVQPKFLSADSVELE